MVHDLDDLAADERRMRREQLDVDMRLVRRDGDAALPAIERRLVRRRQEVHEALDAAPAVGVGHDVGHDVGVAALVDLPAVAAEDGAADEAAVRAAVGHLCQGEVRAEGEVEGFFGSGRARAWGDLGGGALAVWVWV